MLKSIFSSTTVNYPSDIEWLSNDYKASANCLAQTFGWSVNDNSECETAFVEWGLKMNAMVRDDMAYDRGLEQRSTFIFTVPDLVKEIKRLERFGATVHKEPDLSPDLGNWCLMKIPGNIVIGLWSYLPDHELAPSSTTKKSSDEKTITFFELINAHAKEVADFFKNAYGWNFTAVKLLGGPYWYAHDKDKNSFACGIRLPHAGEKNDLIAFVTVKDLSSFSGKVKNAGGKAVNLVEDYMPLGLCQRFILPGNIAIGLWEQTKIQTKTEPAPKVQVAANVPKKAQVATPSEPSKKVQVATKSSASKEKQEIHHEQAPSH